MSTQSIKIRVNTVGASKYCVLFILLITQNSVSDNNDDVSDNDDYVGDNDDDLRDNNEDNHEVDFDTEWNDFLNVK